jgi:hypothetical protein
MEWLDLPCRGGCKAHKCEVPKWTDLAGFPYKYGEYLLNKWFDRCFMCNQTLQVACSFVESVVCDRKLKVTLKFEEVVL